jgi:hypothetical protein
MHAYPLSCFNRLKSIFGNRVRRYISDSREARPALRLGADALTFPILMAGTVLAVTRQTCSISAVRQ